MSSSLSAVAPLYVSCKCMTHALMTMLALGCLLVGCQTAPRGIRDGILLLGLDSIRLSRITTDNIGCWVPIRVSLRQNCAWELEVERTELESLLGSAELVSMDWRDRWQPSPVKFNGYIDPIPESIHLSAGKTIVLELGMWTGPDGLELVNHHLIPEERKSRIPEQLRYIVSGRCVHARADGSSVLVRGVGTGIVAVEK